MHVTCQHNCSFDSSKLTDHEAFATVLNECTTALLSLWVII